MTAPSQHAAELSRKLEDRSATIAVVGLGYVGLPLVRVMHTAGFHVLGFDTDVQKIRMLEHGETYLHHLGDGAGHGRARRLRPLHADRPRAEDL